MRLHWRATGRRLLSAALAVTLVGSAPAQGQREETPEPSYEGRTRSQWEALLEDHDPTQRAAAIQALAGLGAQTLPLFIWAVGDSDPSVRIAAVKAIALLGPQAAPAVPALVDVVLNDPLRAVRLQGIYALGQLGPAAAQAAPTLRSLLQHGDLAMRINAAQALEKITGEAR